MPIITQNLLTHTQTHIMKSVLHRTWKEWKTVLSGKLSQS